MINEPTRDSTFRRKEKNPLISPPNSLAKGLTPVSLMVINLKGRDWFDFLWYVQKKTSINLPLLKNALEQCGPYQGFGVPISKGWLIEHFEKKIRSIDWASAKKDVEFFIPQDELHTLSSWGPELFLQMLNKMENYL